ncbi:carbonic anhydrase [Thiosulfativibrio zosterae]|uniref:carbonic anhydrase n=1 Tax=Thiosulfativibrio zosterae TaxID=2675053 RepID=A0A6F8PKC7_9GAMM|nr:carbonic anhydrase family protein [Thiosulfativibrio zosterae]BBP42528.1 carbonic anhydrase [Thiosulfativibrio zosterae]
MKLKSIALVLGLTASASVFASGHGAHWGYSGHEGPEHWGDLSHEYATCKTGHTQSPIDIKPSADVDLEAIAFDYKVSPMSILNNGHTVQVNFAKGSTMKVEGKTYNLLQVHFHTPSENHLMGKSSPMEAHFVHSTDDGQLAVVAVLIEEGKTDSFIEKIVKAMPKTPMPAATVEGVSLSAMDYLPADKSYYRFAGSLTTPPCSEGVSWFMMKNPAHASKAQIAAIHAIIGNNNRPVMEVNGREIKE